eukprot:2742580-Amphidinium_carterae.1
MPLKTVILLDTCAGTLLVMLFGTHTQDNLLVVVQFEPVSATFSSIGLTTKSCPKTVANLRTAVNNNNNNNNNNRLYKSAAQQWRLMFQ